METLDGWPAGLIEKQEITQGQGAAKGRGAGGRGFGDRDWGALISYITTVNFDLTSGCGSITVSQINPMNQ